MDSMLPTRRKAFCKVPNCQERLEDAGSFHRKCSICAKHAHAEVIVLRGQELRFCQQCGRLHVLSEFDGAKKSCRKQLQKHNLVRIEKRASQRARASLEASQQHLAGGNASFQPPKRQKAAGNNKADLAAMLPQGASLLFCNSGHKMTGAMAKDPLGDPCAPGPQRSGSASMSGCSTHTNSRSMKSDHSAPVHGPGEQQAPAALLAEQGFATSSASNVTALLAAQRNSSVAGLPEVLALPGQQQLPISAQAPLRQSISSLLAGLPAGTREEAERLATSLGKVGSFNQTAQPVEVKLEEQEEEPPRHMGIEELAAVAAQVAAMEPSSASPGAKRSRSPSPGQSHGRSSSGPSPSQRAFTRSRRPVRHPGGDGAAEDDLSDGAPGASPTLRGGDSLGRGRGLAGAKALAFPQHQGQRPSAPRSVPPTIVTGRRTGNRRPRAFCRGPLSPSSQGLPPIMPLSMPGASGPAANTQLLQLQLADLQQQLGMRPTQVQSVQLLQPQAMLPHLTLCGGLGHLGLGGMGSPQLALVQGTQVLNLGTGAPTVLCDLSGMGGIRAMGGIGGMGGMPTIVGLPLGQLTRHASVQPVQLLPANPLQCLTALPGQQQQSQLLLQMGLGARSMVGCMHE